MKPDLSRCTLETPEICHQDATCTPVSPYVCSSTRPRSYRCECNQGYTGNGIDCTGELILTVKTGKSAHIKFLSNNNMAHITLLWFSKLSFCIWSYMYVWLFIIWENFLSPLFVRQYIFRYLLHLWMIQTFIMWSKNCAILFFKYQNRSVTQDIICQSQLYQK